MSLEVNAVIGQVSNGFQTSEAKEMEGPGSESVLRVPGSRLVHQSGFDCTDGSGTIVIREIDPRDGPHRTSPTIIRLSRNGNYNSTVNVEVDLKWTVGQFKAHLRHSQGVDFVPSQMLLRLPKTGSEMRDDSQTLSSCGVAHGDKVDVLAARLRGGCVWPLGI